jgi:LmbE family N-acetylglucosaminyl deacetylase
MKKLLFALFAHPDDESFGPSGTLLLETRAGTELHLILLTSGDGGMNPDNHPDLSKVRLDEWEAAGKLMGASGMHYLGYKDGQLNNHSMIEATERVIELITPIIDAAPPHTKIEFMTNDLNGITGHIDHIVAARTACQVFYTLKERGTPLERIRLCCLSRDDAPENNTNWLYMEAGHIPQEIDETIDARHLHNDITTIIRTHHTQRHDGEYCIQQRGDRLGLNHFIVKT